MIFYIHCKHGYVIHFYLSIFSIGLYRIAMNLWIAVLHSKLLSRIRGTWSKRSIILVNVRGKFGRNLNKIPSLLVIDTMLKWTWIFASGTAEMQSLIIWKQSNKGLCFEVIPRFSRIAKKFDKFCTGTSTLKGKRLFY